MYYIFFTFFTDNNWLSQVQCNFFFFFFKAEFNILATQPVFLNKYHF